MYRPGPSGEDLPAAHSQVQQRLSDSELESFVSPPEYIDHSGMVGQPSLDEATGPRMSNYPEGVYARVISTPDKVVWNMVDNSPPRRKEQSN